MSVTILPTNFPILPLYGRLQIFGVAADSNVYTKWKITIDRNSAWSDWANLGNGAISNDSELVVGYLPDGRMQIFCVSITANLYSTWKTTTDANAPWSDWANLGGSTHYAGFSLGYLPDQRMQLFIYGDDGNIHSSWKTATDPNSSWSEWTSMGPPPSFGGLAIGYLPDERMQIFLAGSNGDLFSRWKITTDPDSPWSDWVSMGALPSGTGLGPPSIGYLPDHRMQLFYIGGDRTLHSMWKTGADPNSGWSAWTNMGGAGLNMADIGGDANDVSIGYLLDGRMQLFTVDQFGQVNSRWKTGSDPNSGWSNWENMGSSGSPNDPFASAVVGYLPDNSMQLFATTLIGKTLYSKWQTDNSPSSPWSDWVSMGPLPEAAGVVGVAIGNLPYDG
jgi:hypothetical protein